MKSKITLLLSTLIVFISYSAQAQIRNVGAVRTSSTASRALKLSSYKTPNAFISNLKTINGVNKDIIRVSAAQQNKFSNQVIASKTKTSTADNGATICKTEYRKLDVTNITQDVLNAESIADLRLGGIYSLTDFKAANYNLVSGEARNPITIGISGLKSVTINEPTDAKLSDGLTDLLISPFVVRPAGNGQLYECKIVNSLSELEVAAGVSYSGYGFNVAAAFQYNKSSKKNKYLVTYSYPVFTAQITSGKNYFVNAAANANKDLVVLDKLTYGAKLLVYFESELNEEDVKASLSGSGWGAKANLSAKQKTALEQCNYQIFLYGESKGVEIATGYTDLFVKTQQMINNVCNSSKRYPLELGAPISYSLKFLNGDIAATNCNANELPSTVCTANPNIPMDLEVNLQAMSFRGGNNFGWIDFEILNDQHNRRGDDIKTVWSVNRDQATNQNVGDVQAPVTKVTFNGINQSDRQNGYLRIWTRLQNRQIGVGAEDVFLVKADNANPNEGLNGIHGNYQGQFYDIKLSDILNTEISKRYTETLTRRNGNGKQIDIEVSAIFKK